LILEKIHGFIAMPVSEIEGFLLARHFLTKVILCDSIWGPTLYNYSKKKT
jgi:hypothetical protein